MIESNIPPRWKILEAGMANFKRKRNRRQVRCTMCTQHRWKGNSSDRRDIQTQRNTREMLGQCPHCGERMHAGHNCLEPQSLGGLDEFRSFIKELAKAAPPWKPGAYYCDISDAIDSMWENVATYSEYVNPVLTLHRAEDDNRVVGARIKNIQALIKGLDAATMPRMD